MDTDAPVGPETATGGVELDADHITTSTRDPAETAERLQRWLAETLGAGSRPEITDVASPEGNGMSSETLLFTATWTADGATVERRLVARIEPPDTAYPVFTTYDLAMQFRVMRLVRDHTAVPVPETAWYEPDPHVLGGPFFVMRRVEGLVPPDVMPYTFGDNWFFDAGPLGRRRPGRHPFDHP
jgi:aminoglycoside phosphotransferase (APT) family kinase protein